MYPNAKEAILKNRSTLLKLADQEKIKYFLLSSALYEKKLLPKTKYAEIRDGKTKEIDRVEAFLEWLDDYSGSSFPEIFDGLCEGLKRSDQQNLGRKLKREAKENGGEPRPVLTNNLVGAPVTKLATPKPKKPKAPKLKLPKVMMDILDDGGALPNGAKPPKTKTPKSKTPRSSKPNGEVNTPKGARRNSIKQANATPTTSGDLSSDTKILSPALNRKRKSGATSLKPEHALGTSFDPRNSVFGYPLKANMGKAMSFKAAKDAFTKKTKSFNFVSHPSKPTRVYFQNKSDLFYDGCAFPVTVGLCTKKVTRKNNSYYICSSKHESPMFRKVPRVQVTFDDGSDALDVTLWKSSVEIFTGKSSDDLEKLDDSSIRQLFDATRGKEATLLVEATKTHQRDLKKTQGREWTMNATVLVGDNIPPPAKKQRG